MNIRIRKEIKKALVPRPLDSDKGDYGRIFILAGSQGMSGACYLTAQAALRSGAGLVTVGVPKSLVIPLARRFTEAMMRGFSETKSGTLSERAFLTVMKFVETQDVLAIGPGLSRNHETQRFIRRVVTHSPKPMVIDADGLNAFKGRADLLKRLEAPAILTPHPGEFVRLFGDPVPQGDQERKKRALEIARDYQVIVVLKGHHTVVASPDGRSYINQTGNPGMATGGSGDVLTGVVAALLGQKKVNAFQAACFGVFVHGLAGDLAARDKGKISLIAGDILGALPRAFQKVLSRSNPRQH